MQLRPVVLGFARAVACAGTLVAFSSGAQTPVVQPAPGIGNQIDWTEIALLDGRTMATTELRGRAVIVQIWASWCPFCALQNPHVQKLYDAWRDRGLQVVAFSIDKTDQAAKDYLKKNGYTFPVAMHSPQVDRWFGPHRTLPETYVVDASGRIVFVHRGEMFAEDIAALARFAPRPG